MPGKSGPTLFQVNRAPGDQDSGLTGDGFVQLSKIFTDRPLGQCDNSHRYEAMRSQAHQLSFEPIFGCSYTINLSARAALVIFGRGRGRSSRGNERLDGQSGEFVARLGAYEAREDSSC